MSARPFVPRLEGEELDLLISRSLDGDLSPEETRDLETVLANDPAARKRQEALSGLVEEARALPVPAPPFALSTRVNANVSEKAARGGSIFHRFGFYPPRGMAIGAVVVLGFAAIAITVMNPAPRPVASTIAQRTDGPVDVFFQEGSRAKDAGNAGARVTAKDGKEAAKKALGAPSESAVDHVAERIVSKEKAREEGEAKQVASVVASSEPALNEQNDKNDTQNERQNKLAKSEADADATRSRRASVDSPALSAAAPQASGGVSLVAPAAPAAQGAAAPAPAFRAMKSAETRSWAVAIRGEGARRWMLRRAPEGRPPASSAQPSSFRVTLDVDGRVTAVRALDARTVQPALLEFVRGLVFAPVGTLAANATGAVTDGFARDREQGAKDERADALQKKVDKSAEDSSEIEVEISAH